MLTTTISDSTGGDASRTTTNTYDAHGDLASVTDPLGNVTRYTYDALGDRITLTTPAGRHHRRTRYDAAGNLLTTTLDGYTGNPSDPIAAENLVQDSRSYDPAGNLASDTNVKGTTTDYTYYGNGALASSYVAGSSGAARTCTPTPTTRRATRSPRALRAAWSSTPCTTPTTRSPPRPPIRRASTARQARSTTRDGNVVTQTQTLTGGGVTQTATMTYNAMDEQLSQTIDNTGGNLTTKYVRDERGPGDLRDRPGGQHHDVRERRGRADGGDDQPGGGGRRPGTAPRR